MLKVGMISKYGDVYPAIKSPSGDYHPYTGGRENDYEEIFYVINWFFTINFFPFSLKDDIRSFILAKYLEDDLEDTSSPIDSARNLIESEYLDSSQLSDRFIQYLVGIFETCDDLTEYTDVSSSEYAQRIDDKLNQCFLRFRVGDKYDPGDSNIIYFRISSKYVNWRPWISAYLWDTYQTIENMPNIWVGHDAESNPPEIVLFEGTPTDFFGDDLKIYEKTTEYPSMNSSRKYAKYSRYVRRNVSPTEEPLS